MDGNSLEEPPVGTQFLLCVQVIDDGPGPATAHTAHLFRPMYEDEQTGTALESLVSTGMALLPVPCSSAAMWWLWLGSLPGRDVGAGGLC